jgi:hypothetical protein
MRRLPRRPLNLRRRGRWFDPFRAEQYEARRSIEFQQLLAS